METNKLPQMNMDKSETDCCPKFDPKAWDEQEFTFDNKLFVKAKTWSIFHFPMNMGSMYKRICEKMETENANPKNYYLVLSHDPSMWRGEHFFATEKDLPGEEMVRLSGKFITKTFEGPYSNMGKWMKKMEKYATDKNHECKKIYFFYTTCPKCAKKYGKNYVVGFAQI